MIQTRPSLVALSPGLCRSESSRRQKIIDTLSTLSRELALLRSGYAPSQKTGTVGRRNWRLAPRRDRVLLRRPIAFINSLSAPARPEATRAFSGPTIQAQLPPSQPPVEEPTFSSAQTNHPSNFCLPREPTVFLNQLLRSHGRRFRPNHRRSPHSQSQRSFGSGPMTLARSRSLLSPRGGIATKLSSSVKMGRC